MVTTTSLLDLINVNMPPKEAQGKRAGYTVDTLFVIRSTIGGLFFFSRVVMGFGDNLYFRAALLCGSTALLSFSLFLVAKILVHFLDAEDAKRPNESLQAWSKYLRDRCCAGILEEITVVGGTLAFSLSLYGRADVGLCPEGASWLETAK